MLTKESMASFLSYESGMYPVMCKSRVENQAYSLCEVLRNDCTFFQNFLISLWHSHHFMMKYSVYTWFIFRNIYNYVIFVKIMKFSIHVLSTGFLKKFSRFHIARKYMQLGKYAIYLYWTICLLGSLKLFFTATKSI